MCVWDFISLLRYRYCIMVNCPQCFVGNLCNGVSSLFFKILYLPFIESQENGVFMAISVVLRLYKSITLMPHLLWHHSGLGSLAIIWNCGHDGCRLHSTLCLLLIWNVSASLFSLTSLVPPPPNFARQNRVRMMDWSGLPCVFISQSHIYTRLVFYYYSWLLVFNMCLSHPMLCVLYFHYDPLEYRWKSAMGLLWSFKILEAFFVWYSDLE